MRIIFFADSYKGGNSHYLQQHIEYNLKKKNHIILFVNHYKKIFPKLKKNKFLTIVNLSPVKERIKVKYYIENLKEEKKYFFFTNPIFLILFFDLLLFNNLNKFCLSLHSGIFNWKIKTFVAMIIFSILSLKLNKILFGSYSSQRWWLTRFPWMRVVNSAVIHNGIDLPKKNNEDKQIQNKKIQISFVGRLEFENDPGKFIEIANYIRNKKKFNFNIFGDGPLKNNLKKKTKGVKFWGWSSKSTIFKNTDILIITSPINNFPYAALEAIAHSKPVVTCSKGDINLIIKNNFNGFILENNNLELFKKSINNIIKNYASFDQKDYKSSLKFNKEYSCEKIWNFFN